MISLGPLAEGISKELSVRGTTFEEHFVSAVRRVMRDLNRDCFLNLDPDAVNSVSDSVDLADAYYDVIVAGVRAYLQELPIFKKDGMDGYDARYHREKALAQCVALKELDPDTGFVSEDDE